MRFCLVHITTLTCQSVGFSVVCTSPRSAGRPVTAGPIHAELKGGDRGQTSVALHVTVGVEEHHQQRRVKQKVHFRVN